MRPRVRLRFAMPAVASLVLAVAAPVLASGPDSHVQPLVDGCQRSDAMQLGLSTPEWLYVNRAQVLAARAVDPTAGRRTVEGVVQDAHPAGDDLYVNHDFNDVDIDVRPDPAFADLVASGNEDGDIGMEWETTRIPTWAWPQPGDRVRASGSWIWDCGHWGDGATDDTSGLSPLLPYDPDETAKDLTGIQAIRGEQTELHPLYEVATFRKDAAGVLAGQATGTNLSHLDTWISGDGSPALAEEECALRGIPPAAARATCSQHRDVGGNYTYVLPLGRKPAPTSTIVVNPVAVHGETDSDLKGTVVTTTPDPVAGTVTVQFTLPHPLVPPTGLLPDLFPAAHFGISVEAGWTKAPGAVHHRVSLRNLHVFHSLDGASEPSQNPIANGPEQNVGEPAEWVLFAAANGHWAQLPGVAQVSSGQDVNLGNVSFDYWLPAGVGPTLYVSGRECDIPLIDCTREAYGATGLSVPPFDEAGFNDHPGRIEDANGAGLPVTGVKTLLPTRGVSAFGHGNEDQSDYTCADTNGCYSVTVAVDGG